MKRWSVDKSRAFVYAIGDLAYLGYDPYFTAPGVGGRILSFAAERSVLDARLETRWRDFEDNSNRPTNSLRTGAQTRFGATYSYYLTPALVLGLHKATPSARMPRPDSMPTGKSLSLPGLPGPSTTRYGPVNIHGPSSGVR